MYSFGLIYLSNRVCWDADTDMPDKVQACFWTMLIGEIIVSVSMIVIAYLIAANTLPNALQFLQGRTKLALGLMITGLTSIVPLAFLSACGNLTEICKSIFEERANQPISG